MGQEKSLGHVLNLERLSLFCATPIVSFDHLPSRIKKQSLIASTHERFLNDADFQILHYDTEPDGVATDGFIFDAYDLFPDAIDYINSQDITVTERDRCPHKYEFKVVTGAFYRQRIRWFMRILNIMARLDIPWYKWDFMYNVTNDHPYASASVIRFSSIEDAVAFKMTIGDEDDLSNYKD